MVEFLPSSLVSFFFSLFFAFSRFLFFLFVSLSSVSAISFSSFFVFLFFVCLSLSFYLSLPCCLLMDVRCSLDATLTTREFQAEWTFHGECRSRLMRRRVDTELCSLCTFSFQCIFNLRRKVKLLTIERRLNRWVGFFLFDYSVPWIRLESISRIHCLLE